MKIKTATSILEWLEKVILGRKPNLLDIGFFGGEPLLNRPVMKFLAEGIRSLREKYGTAATFGIVTNGYLLTPQVADELLMNEIDFFQITLDGPKQIHDQRRKLRNGKGTFDVVFKNIKSLCEKEQARILINTNFDGYNTPFIIYLIDLLYSEGLQNRVFLNFGSVIECEQIDSCKKNSKESEQQEAKSHTYKTGIPSSAVGEIYVELYSYALGKGFNLKDPLSVGLCTRISDNNVAIDPSGNIYKCLTSVGKEIFKAGNVNDDFSLTDSSAKSRF